MLITFRLFLSSRNIISGTWLEGVDYALDQGFSAFFYNEDHQFVFGDTEGSPIFFFEPLRAVNDNNE